MVSLQFRYVNWRGDDHEYVIEPDGTTVFRDGHWLMSGHTITRDGEERQGNPRRSFIITEMRGIEEVPA